MNYIIYSTLLCMCTALLSEGSAMNIEKKVLSNGLTIFVKPTHTVPKVSIQLWYNVGSKDEKTGEKGIAHLIEHMIFKGTKKMLSETDIKAVVHTLSGDCNAFTSYDYTGYKFNMPSHTWREMLPIMADCMSNAAFKDQHLNSEMKAVIQELKMIKDNHTRQMAYDLLSLIFPDHPYHYPLIGYKEDLWSVNGKDLARFYKKHYHPNNAVLVVVGDVKTEEVFDLAERCFGAIPANEEYHKENFYHNKDICSKSLTLYRDVQQPIGIAAFVIPGLRAKLAHITDVANLILGGGKQSRLYKELVDQKRLVTSISVSSIDLFDHGLFFIIYTPKNSADIPTIQTHIQEILKEVATHGVHQEELHSALNKAKMYEYELLESNEMQAYLIGQYYFATGDPNYAFNYLTVAQDTLNHELQSFFKLYFRPSIMHTGLILPLMHETDKKEWLTLQEASDTLDNEILSARERHDPIEQPRYALTLKAGTAPEFNFPKAQAAHLTNGLKLLWYHNPQTPKINIALEFTAKSWFDPEDKQGLYTFLARMMSEGTKNYTADQLAHELESRGIMLSIHPGGISMTLLHDDFEKGLELLYEIVAHATFPEEKMSKVHAQLQAQLTQFWDNPSSFASQIVAERLYKGHPYSKSAFGTAASLASIRRDDLVAFYNQYISPQGTTMVIVGDLSNIDIPAALQQMLGTWHGPAVSDLAFPSLDKKTHTEYNYPINRDQVVLTLASLSIDRNDPDYDALVLFDNIFGGAGLHSKLMQLREQTGLFYTINGATTAQAGKQPGMFIVRTIVSLHRAQEAEQAIKQLIDNVTKTITEQELQEAKNSIAQSLIGIFDSNAKIAQAFLFLDKYDLPADYFDHRAKDLARISLQEVIETAQKYLHADQMSVIRIGRV